MRENRKATRATSVAVNVAVGGAALVLRFQTANEGELTIAVNVPGARQLAQMLIEQAQQAEALTTQGGTKRPPH